MQHTRVHTKTSKSHELFWILPRTKNMVDSTVAHTQHPTSRRGLSLQTGSLQTGSLHTRVQQNLIFKKKPDVSGKISGFWEKPQGKTRGKSGRSSWPSLPPLDSDAGAKSQRLTRIVPTFHSGTRFQKPQEPVMLLWRDVYETFARRLRDVCETFGKT